MDMDVLEHETVLPLIPPARLGALLLARRKQENIDQATIAQRSYGLFGVREIELLENGRAPLTEETIRAVTQLYDLGAGPVVPGRSRLVVDLDMGTIESMGKISQLPRVEAPAVLERYLALVYVMRGVEPGAKIRIRQDDINILAEALAFSPEAVRDQIESLMTSPVITRRTRRLSRRLSIPGVGLLVGFTTMGALILAPAASAEEFDSSGLSAEVSEAVETAAPVSGVALTMPNDGQNEGTVDQASSSPNNRELENVSEFFSPEAATADPESPTLSVLDALTPPGTVAKPAPSTTVPSATVPAEPTTVLPSTTATPTTVAPTTVAPTTVPAPTVAPQPPITAPAAVPETTTAPATVPPLARSQEIGLQAQALIPYDVQNRLPGWVIRFEGDRPGYRGMTNRTHKTVTVYVRSSDTPATVAGVLAHELGHVLDLELLNNDQRLHWLEVRGMPQVWWVDNGYSDFEAGQGDFAEAIAALWVGSPSNSHHGAFTHEQLVLAASFIQ